MTRVAVSLALVALFAVQIQGQGIIGYITNSFSLLRPQSLEGPEFRTIRNASARDPESFEERVYPAGKWACIAQNVAASEGSPTRAMFLDLFRYFSGDNEPRKEFDITIPVNTLVKPKADSNETYYETCLYLPAKIQADAPKPNNPSIFIEDKPEFTVLTRKQSGYLFSDSAWSEEAKTLRKLLEDKQEEADFSYYYRNSYDTPFRIFNRRNEVWYVRPSGPSEAAVPAEPAEVPAVVSDEKKTEEKKAEEKPKVEEKKTEEKKKVEEKKSEEKKTEEKKVEEKKTEEKKVEEKKTEEKKAVVEKKVEEQPKVEDKPQDAPAAVSDEKKAAPAEEPATNRE